MPIIVETSNLHFTLGNALALIGAIIAATVNNINTIIGATALIGLAGAVQLSYTALTGKLVPIKPRGYWFLAIVIPVVPLAFFGGYLC